MVLEVPKTYKIIRTAVNEISDGGATLLAEEIRKILIAKDIHLKNNPNIERVLSYLIELGTPANSDKAEITTLLNKLAKGDMLFDDAAINFQKKDYPLAEFILDVTKYAYIRMGLKVEKLDHVTNLEHAIGEALHYLKA